MLKSRKTVHVFSIIPKLSELLAKRLPEITIETVPTTNEGEKNKSQIQNAEVFLSDGHLIAENYETFLSAKWVQCTFAGVEGLVKKVQNGPKPTFPVTRMASPVFSQLMGEYIIGWILNYERDWVKTQENQSRCEWVKSGKILNHRSLLELTVGVLGVGRIGSEVICSLKKFGCKVIGLGRNPSPPNGLSLDEYFSSSKLSSLLPKCDYIINVLPSTAQTKGFLGKETLRLASKKPVFINVGRADIISEPDIINALDQSWISAAILDVFETEPLPSTSDLWLHPKVIITPHVSAVSRPSDVVDCFCTNFERYIQGEPLHNVVDWDRGY